MIIVSSNADLRIAVISRNPIPAFGEGLLYRKMLQRNLPQEAKARRKSEYKEWKNRVRRLIEESKRRVDEEFGRKLSQNFSENKKLFCRGEEGEVKRECRKNDVPWGAVISSEGVWGEVCGMSLT